MIVAPRKGEHLYERTQTLPFPLEQVFPFFADPYNLERITPPFLRFQVLSSTTESIAEGTLLDYRLRLRGLPIRWRTNIALWEPPYRFIDEQLRGPYKVWVHEHTFQDLGDQTRMTDRIRYAVPGGALVNRLFVRPDVERIFQYRSENIVAAMEEALLVEAA